MQKKIYETTKCCKNSHHFGEAKEQRPLFKNQSVCIKGVSRGMEEKLDQKFDKKLDQKSDQKSVVTVRVLP